MRFKIYKEKKGRGFTSLVFYPAIFRRIRTMLAIAAMAARRASTIATIMSGERLALVSLVADTSLWTVPMLVLTVPRSVWMVATLPCVLVTTPLIVPRVVWMLATPSLIVVRLSRLLRLVVTVPRLVSSVATSPCRETIFASRLLKLVVTVPRLVWSVATPSLMVEMEPVRPLTASVTLFMVVVIVPIVVDRVAVLPSILVMVAFIEAKSERVKLMEVTLLFMSVTVWFMSLRMSLEAAAPVATTENVPA